MFQKHYKSAMSQAVPKELLARTAHRMEEALLQRPAQAAVLEKRPVWTRSRILAVAAAFAVVIISSMGGYQRIHKGVNTADYSAAPPSFSSEAADMAAPDALMEEGDSIPKATAPDSLDSGGAMTNDYLPSVGANGSSKLEESGLEPLSFRLPSSDGDPAGVLAPETESAAAAALALEAGFSGEDMPVYRNTSIRNEANLPTGEEGMTAAEMKEEALRTAETFGYSSDELLEEYTYVEDAGQQYCAAYTLSQASGTPLVRIERDGEISVRLDSLSEKEISLEEIQADPDACRVSLEQGLRNLVTVKFSEMLDADGLSVSENLYYLEEEDSLRCDLVAYNGAEAAASNSLSYSFNSLRLSVSADSPDSPWLNYQEESFKELVGYYPVLSLGEAEELLYEGRYYTALSGEQPAPVPSGETVSGVELVYLTSGQMEYYQPVYRFLVEIPREILGISSAAAERMNAYGYYYVPAVRPEYLSAGE